MVQIVAAAWKSVGTSHSFTFLSALFTPSCLIRQLSETSQGHVTALFIQARKPDGISSTAGQ